MLPTFAVDSHTWVSLFFAQICSYLAVIEPDMTVWVFGIGGSLAGVMNGPKRKFHVSVLSFLIGICSGLIFEHVVNHLGWHPAEAFVGAVLSDDLIAALRKWGPQAWSPFSKGAGNAH